MFFMIHSRDLILIKLNIPFATVLPYLLIYASDRLSSLLYVKEKCNERVNEDYSGSTYTRWENRSKWHVIHENLMGATNICALK
ncbi:hypothetical protein BLOT_011993 [Blomia tropicalis]|nr:hypothetical protein BLOT_011993 [Blomia tropicalis]